MNHLIAAILCILSCNITLAQTDDLPKGSIGYFLTKALDMSREKNYDQALLYIDSAFFVDKNNEHSYALKAEVLWMMKRFSEAADNYQMALLLDKDSSYLHGAYLFLGVLYEKSNKRTHAQLQYLKAIYLFENKKRKNDRLFAYDNKVYYALAIKLAGNEKMWNKLLDDSFYQENLYRYIGKSRQEVIDIYFQHFSGD